MSARLETREFVQTPSGLVLPSYVAERRYAAKRTPIAMDFFAGAGGFSLGMIKAGYEVVAAAEWDCAAVQTYMTNLCRYGKCRMVFVEDSDRERMEKYLLKQFKQGEKAGLGAKPPMAGTGWIASEPPSTHSVSFIFVGDVRKLTGEQILKVIGRERGELDVVTGGPPCQGFSKAGKQNIMDPRNSLVFEFARLILELNPKTFVMEEVPAILDMVTPEGLPVVEAFMRIIEDGNFTNVEYLKKAVAQQTGISILRSKGKPSKASTDAETRQSNAPHPKSPPKADQLNLFGDAA